MLGDPLALPAAKPGQRGPAALPAQKTFDRPARSARQRPRQQLRLIETPFTQPSPGEGDRNQDGSPPRRQALGRRQHEVSHEVRQPGPAPVLETSHQFSGGSDVKTG